MLSRATKLPLLQIQRATFYRHHPRSVQPTNTTGSAPSNPPLFPDLTFSLPFPEKNTQATSWAVVSNESLAATTFLQILRGHHIGVPPRARSYPALAAAHDGRGGVDPRHAIQYIGFDAQRDGGGGAAALRGSYLSARYESRREELDFSLLDYLRGDTQLNAAEELRQRPREELLERVIADLSLDALLGLPVTHLSHGQMRRARIAKGLLGDPKLILLDSPFLGLDPHTVERLSSLLGRLALNASPALLLSLRPDDHVPAWITQLMYVSLDYRHSLWGKPEDVVKRLSEVGHKSTDEMKDEKSALRQVANRMHGGKAQKAPTKSRINVDLFDLSGMRPSPEAKGVEPVMGMSDQKFLEYIEKRASYDAGLTNALRSTVTSGLTFSRDGHWPYIGVRPQVHGEPIVEMRGAKVSYGNQTCLGGWHQTIGGENKEGLWWTVRRGQRWGVFGPNGSGKTTLLSLLTSDHPQAYAAPMHIFGRSRLPEAGKPGVPLFELKANIGHASPEVHALFPKHLSVRQVLESAWADTPLSRPRLSHAADLNIDEALLHFAPELNPSYTAPADSLAATDESAAPSTPAFPKIGYVIDPSSATIRPEDLHWNHTLLASFWRAKRVDSSFSLSELTSYADTTPLSHLSFSAQRLALFLRAVIANPALIILDEAFSAMDSSTRDKALSYLSWGPEANMRAILAQCAAPVSRAQRRDRFLSGADVRVFRERAAKRGRFVGLTGEQALVVVAHRADEVPGCVRQWIALPENGSGSGSGSGSASGGHDAESPRFGSLGGPVEGGRRWEWIWGGCGPGPGDKAGWEAVERPASASASPSATMDVDVEAEVLASLSGDGDRGRAAAVRKVEGIREKVKMEVEKKQRQREEKRGKAKREYEVRIVDGLRMKAAELDPVAGSKAALKRGTSSL